MLENEVLKKYFIDSKLFNENNCLTLLVAVRIRCPISATSESLTRFFKTWVRDESGRLFPIVAFNKLVEMYLCSKVFGASQAGGYQGRECSLPGSMPINSLTKR